MASRSGMSALVGERDHATAGVVRRSVGRLTVVRERWGEGLAGGPRVLEHGLNHGVGRAELVQRGLDVAFRHGP